MAQVKHGSEHLAPLDIERPTSARAASPAGIQDEDDAPLLGDKRSDEGTVDMGPMPIAAWLLLAAAVMLRTASYVVLVAFLSPTLGAHCHKLPLPVMGVTESPFTLGGRHVAALRQVLGRRSL